MSNKDTLILAIFTFITVVLWTVFEAYHTYVTSTIPSSMVEEIKPLDPKLPKNVLEKIKNRYNLSSLPSPVSTVPAQISTSSSNNSSGSASF